MNNLKSHWHTMKITSHWGNVSTSLGVGLGALLHFGIATSSFADWPQFRGATSNAVELNSDLPVEFDGASGKNVAWKVSIPGRSVGGAIVVGNQVVTTASVGMDERRVRLHSYDVATGAQNWTQEFVARGRPYCHPTSANAAPTPTSDGKRIYAFYSSNDLACVDLDGNLVWYRSLTSDFVKAFNDTGMSSSPIVIDGVCVVQIECQGESFVAGLDSENGVLLWKKDRPRKANWSSPVSYKNPEGKSVIVIHSGSDLVGLDPKSGDQVWMKPVACSVVPSSLVFENRLYVPSRGLVAFDLSSSGGEPSELWKSSRIGVESSSPVVVKDRIYTIKGPAVYSGDIYTGDVKWQARVAEGSVWSSPVVAKDRMYLFSMDGKCSVTQLGESEGVRLALNELGEDVLGTPAIVGDAMYVRSVSSLWKIAK
ncbi:MAG: PQQ-binding-like beta-propeller repeat protein [Pirellula sp.]|jgi:outer membrane protein assembly factor BamB